ncbi:50S ribosomal protein L21 [Miltoncostaea marina]|uniref:50S ribosomal protein L21 n=1 Tax=Miltoncostaea marina TaxID=2843215 RepID=UPI001C3CB487|nr:50S ribosomal protein L21 [Miltoncostaea marina]
MPNYAVIALGGKQYRVREGERLLVDRLAHDEGASFQPRVLATGDDGGIADGGAVTATVEEHVLGRKVRVFTYKPKRNSRRSRGHRSRLSRVRIESITAG